MIARVVEHPLRAYVKHGRRVSILAESVSATDAHMTVKYVMNEREKGLAELCMPILFCFLAN